MTSINRKNLYLFAKGILICVLYIVFAVFFGFIPKIMMPSLGINFNMAGIVWDSNPMVSQSTLYPYGNRLFEGPLYEIVGLITRHLFSNPMDSLNCIYFILYTISYFSTVIFINTRTTSLMVLVSSIVLIYLNPFFSGNISIPTVGVSSMLITTSLLCDYLIDIHGSNERSQIKTFCLSIVLRAMLVSTGWYIGVIFAVYSCLFEFYRWILDPISNKKINRKGIVFYTVMHPFSWALAMGCNLLITPREMNGISNSIDIINGESVDIITLLFPTSSYFVSRIVGSIDEIIPQGFSLAGDGTMWNNYLGYTLIGCFIYGIISKKIIKNSYSRGLIFVALIGLVLSLGPGLKFLCIHESHDTISYADYLVPLNDVYPFPWYRLFMVFPFKAMRATYRWLLIPRIAMIVMAIDVMDHICNQNKRRIIVAILALLMIVEYYPVRGVVDYVRQSILRRQQIAQLDIDLVDPLRDIIDVGDRVAVFTKGENAYLLPYIMSQLGARCYEGGGDKAIVAASTHKPNVVLTWETTKSVDEAKIVMEELFSDDLCEWVMFPYFSTRWNSYSWPVSSQTRDDYRQEMTEVIASLKKTTEFYDGEYFLMIKNPQNME